MVLRIRSLVRAVVVGAGSFGTAIAVLLARGGLRTTLQTRTEEQAEQMRETRENSRYLPGVQLPQELRIESVDAGLSRAELVFLGCRRRPSRPRCVSSRSAACASGCRSSR